ncbi:thiamine diphosphokinase [Ruminococcus bovis]|uniref:Thiamine diphosphokinase n=2 Tax=Oscillospiraceae TaxID=216572 RepID=A0A4P8XXM5_9FIRM|nr:thiamine diphosphokinase [Ruminococcus bovis]
MGEKKMRCVIISGSPDTNVEEIKSLCTNDDFIVCADSGYSFAKKAGLTPNLIIGDFDSLKEELPQNTEVVKLNTHKDDTDTEHCVMECIRRGYKDFLLLGSIGGRTDHTFANIATLAFLSEYNYNGIARNNGEEIRILKEGSYEMNNKKGLIFSVFPYGCESVNVTYKGAEYMLNNKTLTYNVSRGISNVFVDDEAEITINRGRAILLTYYK